MAILKDVPNAAAAGNAETTATPAALAELLQQVAAMRQELAQVAAREAELRIVLERDTELDPLLEQLRKTIGKTTLPGKVSTTIDQAELRLDPFPHMVIDDLLPIVFYTSLLKGIPPVELFENKPTGKTHLSVPFSLAPRYSQRVWSFLASDLIPNVIAPRLVEKFRVPIDEWIEQNWPSLAPESVTLHGSGGRIMFRRRGYRILPHRDPKWSFLTCILYLARPRDSSAWGTQLYAVDDDQEAKSTAPHWIDEKRCRLVEDVAYLPNRLLVFLNSVGAHGAYIPADALPETLERYIYQFRIGPTLDAMTTLKSLLPEERKPFWAGKTVTDY